MQDLNVAVVQPDIVWQSPEANRDRLQAAMQDLVGVDLVLLPEMFATGFTMAPAGCAEAMQGESVAWLRARAAAIGAAVAGSLAISDESGYLNRFLFARPEGVLDTYDKRPLCRMAGEHEVYAPGTRRAIVEWRGWRLCPMVCYDLRFPVWSRNRGDYDALIYVANWPERRREHWRALLVARAIENQAYVVGVNRVGVDGNGVAYAGESLVVDPWGQVLLDAGSGACVGRARFSAATLAACRERFPVHLDADDFLLG